MTRRNDNILTTIDYSDDVIGENEARELMIAEEEFWPCPNFSLRTMHQIHTLCFGHGGNSCDGASDRKVLRYKSISGDEMTPLDMIYKDDMDRRTTKKKSSTLSTDDEFYDGTGNLMWMAAVRMHTNKR
jgi:hypothetical protein